MLESRTCVKLRSVIGGTPTGRHRREVALRDPATGEDAFHAELVTTRDVARAVEVARDAQPVWGRTPAIARGGVLRQAADVLEDRREELAHRMTSEMGKVLAEGRAEVDEAAFYLRFMSGEGARLVGETRPSADPRRLSIAERLPAGVVAAITPWNFPLCIPTWKIAAALVVGDSVVLKPALQTAGTGLALAEGLCTAGLPAGALNVLVGTGEEAGQELARHADVRVLTFTGSTAVGHRLAGLVGGRGARAALELGGKNVAVVLADADLEHARNGSRTAPSRPPDSGAPRPAGSSSTPRSTTNCSGVASRAPTVCASDPESIQPRTSVRSSMPRAAGGWPPRWPRR